MFSKLVNSYAWPFRKSMRSKKVHFEKRGDIFLIIKIFDFLKILKRGKELRTTFNLTVPLAITAHSPGTVRFASSKNLGKLEQIIGSRCAKIPGAMLWRRQKLKSAGAPRSSTSQPGSSWREFKTAMIHSSTDSAPHNRARTAHSWNLSEFFFWNVDVSSRVRAAAEQAVRGVTVRSSGCGD